MGNWNTLRILLLATTSLSAARIAPMTAPEGGFADMVERAVPSVVRIVTAKAKTDGGEGSGAILSRDGYILTNHHVVDGASQITVHLSDERELPATVVASDASSDLAVLKIEAANLPALSFGDSTRVRIGEYALAIGNPFGVGTTVTLGIISAKGDGDYLQTDAAINPGNSGGPLLNAAGEIIGINTAIVSPSGGSSGVGFAIPSNLARDVMTELITKGKVERGYLGVGLQPMTPALAEAMGVKRGGAIVTDVAAGSPAAAAGLRKGDVVAAINGKPLREFGRLRFYIAQARPGASMQWMIARGGEESNVSFTLGRRPSEENVAGAALLDRREAGQGIVVASVVPDSPAAGAGLQAGDVIVGANRQAVAAVADLQTMVADPAGKPVLLEVSREGTPYFLALSR